VIGFLKVAASCFLLNSLRGGGGIFYNFLMLVTLFKSNLNL